MLVPEAGNGAQTEVAGATRRQNMERFRHAWKVAFKNKKRTQTKAIHLCIQTQKRRRAARAPRPRPRHPRTRRPAVHRSLSYQGCDAGDFARVSPRAPLAQANVVHRHHCLRGHRPIRPHLIQQNHLLGSCTTSSPTEFSTIFFSSTRRSSC